MKLLIHNANNDSIWITPFNKNIPHSSAFSFRNAKKRFYWDLLTLSNQKEQDVIFIMPSFDLKTSKKMNYKKNITIVIPPNRTFVSDVYMWYSPFVAYPQGYYKLYLFDKTIDKCIAETIIEIK